jgi:hypothetical protein
MSNRDERRTQSETQLNSISEQESTEEWLAKNTETRKDVSECGLVPRPENNGRAG